MQLCKVRVIGLGRLSDATMKVRGKITAVVGPNEAGKSTLLRSLASLSNRQPFSDAPGGDIPRRTEPAANAPAIEISLALDVDDFEAIAGIGSETVPTHLTVTKTYGGTVTRKLDPLPRRPRAHREPAAIAASHAVDRLREASSAADEEMQTTAHSLVDLAVTVVSALEDEADPATLSGEAIQSLRALRDGLAGCPEKFEVASYVQSLTEALEAEELPHPTDAILAVLSRRVPVFVLFGQVDRDLAYEYDLDGMTIETAPPALRNLAVSGNLNLQRLLDDVAAERKDATEEHIADTNDALRELFEASWTAGSGTAAVHLRLDGTTLSVMVTSARGRFVPITDRSDGLRMFVALTTFVRAHSQGDRPVLLLIDEAENHLHYDAQADLISVMTRQEIASQVVYTTHSAGCLPDELGGNIVAVVPDAATGLSYLDSTYWSSGLGFSPLMMAMGAGAAAITPARYAILAEGHSEALILPRLVREATGLLRLGYQIAAGVAEAGRSDIPHLDAEAGNVAYLVDGDGGGAANAKKLLRADIPRERIIHLGGEGSDLCLEDLITEDAYALAADKARRALLHEPSKTEVAAYLIDVEGTLLKPDKVDLLSALHYQMLDALKVPEERRPQLTSR